MVLVNTFLLCLEAYLMAKAGAWSPYYDMRLPMVYSLFDVALTLILCAEISLQLAALYECRVCRYLDFSAEHKADVLVFLLSLLLCVFFPVQCLRSVGRG